MSEHNLEIQRSLGVHARDSKGEPKLRRRRAADTESEVDAADGATLPSIQVQPTSGSGSAAYDDYDLYLQNLAGTDGMREAPSDD